MKTTHRPPRHWRFLWFGLLPLLLASAAAGQPCTGDCDGDGRVTVDELVTGVNLALRLRELTDCPAFDLDQTGEIEVHELVAAVQSSFQGCIVTPTVTYSSAPTPTTTPNPPTPTVSAVQNGLSVLDRVDVPSGQSGTPHVFDMEVRDRLYLADSFGAAVAYSLDEAGLSLEFFSEPLLPTFVRCTSLALHAPSRRLYCAAVDVERVALLDADTGELVGPTNFDFTFSRGYRDLHVVGDELFLAAFDAGLQRAEIREDGSLGSLETVLQGDAVGIDGDAERLVVLDRAKGLRIVEDGREVRTVPLPGPPMRLAVRDKLAAVALGSQGAVVVDLATGETIVEAHPRCVVTDADYRDGALAIACTSGLYLYRTRPELRTVGWVPAVYASLGARFVGDVLVATDWRIVTAYRVNLSGRAIGLDAPRGFLLERGQGIRFAVRNPDDQAQHIDGRMLPPQGELMIEVPPGDADEEIILATDEQRPRGRIIVKIARDKPQVSFGEPFPFSLTSRYVSFIQPDCPLQFPALEDLLWMSARGAAPGGLQPLVLFVTGNADDPWPTGSFLGLWGEAVEAYHLATVFPAAPNGFEIFDTYFSATHHIAGADTTVELTVDADGRIAYFDRVYRGAYPLAAALW